MLPNIKKLPGLKRKKNNNDEEKHKEDEYKSNEQLIKEKEFTDNKKYDRKIIIDNNINQNLDNDINDINNGTRNYNRYTKKSISEGDIPEFLLRPENDHYLQNYMRMRQRNLTDGAIIINLEIDDIANNRVDLYDNKGINLILPSFNENAARNIDYFIENINRDKFVKIPKQTVLKMQRIEKLEEEKKKLKNIVKDKEQKINLEKINSNVDIHRITEDEMFENFDKKLTEMINKTANKISLLFLFIQGLLAGKLIANFNYLNLREIYNSKLENDFEIVLNYLL